MMGCKHRWSEKVHVRSDGSGWDRCDICGAHREITDRIDMADLTDAELNTFDSVSNELFEVSSEERKRWAMVPRIIAELRRHRAHKCEHNGADIDTVKQANEARAKLRTLLESPPTCIYAMGHQSKLCNCSPSCQGRRCFYCLAVLEPCRSAGAL